MKGAQSWVPMCFPGLEGSSGALGPEDTHNDCYIEPCLEKQGWKNHSNSNSGFYFLQLTYFIDSKRHHLMI